MPLYHMINFYLQIFFYFLSFYSVRERIFVVCISPNYHVCSCLDSPFCLEYLFGYSFYVFHTLAYCGDLMYSTGGCWLNGSSNLRDLLSFLLVMLQRYLKYYCQDDSLFYWHYNHSDRYLGLLFYGVTSNFQFIFSCSIHAWQESHQKLTLFAYGQVKTL